MDMSKEFHPVSKPNYKKKTKQKDIPKDIRRFVLERDRHCCVRCGSMNGLHLHHIITKGRYDPRLYNFKNGVHDQRNLMTVCFVCHDSIHKYPDMMKWALTWQKKRFGEVLKYTNQ